MNSGMWMTIDNNVTVKIKARSKAGWAKGKIQLTWELGIKHVWSVDPRL